MLPYASKDSVVNEIKNNLLSSEDSSGNKLFSKARFTPLSRIMAIVNALSRVVYLFVDTALLSIQKAIHPHTALEPDLYEWLKQYGLKWKEAKAAVWDLRIGSTDPVVLDIPIPQGQIVSTPGADNAKIQFRLMDTYVLPGNVSQDSRGFYTIPVQAECLLMGPIGNVAQEAISELDSPPEGINVVYNPDPTPATKGIDRESIADVRLRLSTAEDAQIGKWTPPWYIMIASTHSNVARAVFKSSKELGIPGLVKLFLLGRNGEVTSAEMQEILDDFDSDENNPGGAARVLLENFTTLEINKIIHVQFADTSSIPDQSVLDNVADEYFVSLGEAETYNDSDVKDLYLALPRVVKVVTEPPGDVIVPAGSVAVEGSGFRVIGEVYTGQ